MGDKVKSIEDALKAPFDISDYETMKFLISKLTPIELKWESWITDITYKIARALEERPYFRLAYMSKISFSLTEIPATAETPLEVFERDAFLDKKGRLDMELIRSAARIYCVKQMERLL